MPTVNEKNLRKLRIGQSLTLLDLQDASGVNQSTIHKIETGRRPNPHLSTVRKLADALGVEPGILTGDDLEDEADSLEFFSRKSKLAFKMSDDARNSLRLVADRYGCEPEHILHVAPFLFHWAAEASLRDRQVRLDAINGHLSALEAVDAPKHLADFYFEGWRGDDVLEAEQRSINKRDLFGLISADEALPGDFEISTDNPWVRFLSALADQSGGSTEFEYWTPRWNHFAYSVAREDALALVGGNVEAAEHIMSGRARLHELPSSVRDEGAEAVARWAIAAGEKTTEEFENSILNQLGV